MAEQSYSKRIAKNTIFLYFRMLLIMGVNLYISRVLLSYLGVEDYGIYNIVGGLVVMFSSLCGSLGGATSRYIIIELGRKNQDKLNRIFNVALFAHGTIALLIMILCETAGLWLFYYKLVIPEPRINVAFWVFQISILTTFFSLTQVPYNACIIAHEDMKIYAYIGLVEALLKLAVVFALLISPFDKLVFYALLLCLIQIMVMLAYRFYCRRYSECKLLFCKDMVLFKELFTYAGSDMIGVISVLAQGQGLNLLLNIFFGPAVNAARAIAYQVQGAVSQFSNNFFAAARPQIIKLYAEGKIDEMMCLVYRSSWISFYLLLMISLPLCLERDFVLSLWLGVYPDYTGSFLILIMILCLIQSLKMPRSAVFHATGHILRSNVMVGLILCAAFPLAHVFLKLGGSPESVFWAANISLALSEFVSVYLLKRYMAFSIKNYLFNIYGRCFIVSVLSSLIVYCVYRELEAGVIRLVSISFFSLAVVVLFAYTIGIDYQLRQKINSVVLSKLKG